MKFTMSASYTITVNAIIEAEDEDAARDIIFDLDGEICTEHNGNSVFIYCLPDGVEEATLEADGCIRNINLEEM